MKRTRIMLTVLATGFLMSGLSMHAQQAVQPAKFPDFMMLLARVMEVKDAVLDQAAIQKIKDGLAQIVAINVRLETQKNMNEKEQHSLIRTRISLVSKLVADSSALSKVLFALLETLNSELLGSFKPEMAQKLEPVLTKVTKFIEALHESAVSLDTQDKVKARLAGLSKSNYVIELIEALMAVLLDVSALQN
ncbi:MAG: hypothetical protein NTX86_04940 [Candidatus Dependentiae bacterium]|nr:hypothetical protein [Candidatus Dependentiae bacterium]